MHIALFKAHTCVGLSPMEETYLTLQTLSIAIIMAQ